ILTLPSGAIVADVLPAATVLPSAAVNAGQLTSIVPWAREPSARYTMPWTVVVCMARPRIGTSNNRPASNPHHHRHLSIFSIAVTRRSLAACFVRLLFSLRALRRRFPFILPPLQLIQQHFAQ